MVQAEPGADFVALFQPWKPGTAQTCTELGQALCKFSTQGSVHPTLALAQLAAARRQLSPPCRLCLLRGLGTAFAQAIPLLVASLPGKVQTQVLLL